MNNRVEALKECAVDPIACMRWVRYGHSRHSKKMGAKPPRIRAIYARRKTLRAWPLPRCCDPANAARPPPGVASVGCLPVSNSCCDLLDHYSHQASRVSCPGECRNKMVITRPIRMPDHRLLASAVRAAAMAQALVSKLWSKQSRFEPSERYQRCASRIILRAITTC